MINGFKKVIKEIYQIHYVNHNDEIDAINFDDIDSLQLYLKNRINNVMEDSKDGSFHVEKGRLRKYVKNNTI